MTAPRTIDTDVAIVGGGIVGASAALALCRKGVAVVLLERDLCGSRSSGVNYGGVRRQGRPLSQLPLAQRAHEIWACLPELVGTDGEYLRSGHFKIGRSEADMAALERYADLSRDFGLGIELVSGATLRERCPWLGGRAVGGSLCPDDGQANPRLVSPAFALAARRAGAQIFERTPLTEVAHDGQGFTLRSGTALQVRAPVLLNCAGAWAGPLAAQFGEAVPLHSGHPAMAVTEPLPFFMHWSLGVEGGGIYCRQVARGNLVLGGGSGLALDADRARSERSALAALSAQAVELLPALKHAHFIRTWSGTEGYLPDRQPVLSSSRTTPGLVHGFGFAGAGFQIGPAAGEALAALATVATGAAAQTKTLYIGMNGGTMEKTYTQYVFPAFEKLHGVKVVVPGTSSDILAKAQANKDSPQMHVMFLDDGIMVRAMGMGLCEKQKPNPHLADLYPAARFKDDLATGVSVGMTGIAYNAKMFADKGWAAPTSWMDFADPKYKGKVVFQSMPSSFGLHGFLMFNRIQGGNDKNVEPGFNNWAKTIGPNVLEYIPSSAKISEMVQTGEAAIFPLTPTAVEALKTKGIPVEYAQPKEGSVVLLTAQCVIARNSEPELAQKLAEFLLSPLAQANVLQFGAQIPTNPKAPAVGEGAEQVAKINQWMKNAVTLDWDSVNASRPAWNARWNKTIER